MSIKRTITKSCCGGSGVTITLYLDKTITSKVVPTFEAANYIIPAHYTTSGIFYARSPEGLVASGSYGTTKLIIKVGSFERDKKLDEFEQLLETALNS
jgi:hypothetical protein